MKKFITKKTIFLALIVLIAGIVASQAFAHMGGGRYNMMPGNQMGYGNHMGYGNNMGYGNHMGYGNNGNGMMGNKYMMEDLSAEDQKKMLDQMNTFFTSTKEIREQSYQKRLELNKEYAKSEKDQDKIDSLRKELFELSSEFEKKRFSHRTTMQKLFPKNNAGYFRGMGNGYGNNCF